MNGSNKAKRRKKKGNAKQKLKWTHHKQYSDLNIKKKQIKTRSRASKNRSPINTESITELKTEGEKRNNNNLETKKAHANSPADHHTRSPPTSSPIRSGSAKNPHPRVAHSREKPRGAAPSSDSLPREHNLTAKDAETLEREREGFRFLRMRERDCARVSKRESERIFIFLSLEEGVFVLFD